MSNKQFISNLSATYADVRKLDVKKINLKGKNILEYIKESVPTIKHSQDTRETVTENDLWGQWVETKSDGTVIVHDDWVTNPNGDYPWNTSITKVVNDKAYVGDTLYGNIQTEKIKDGRSFFYMDSALTSFAGNLDNLVIGGGSGTGDGMFYCCSNLKRFNSDLSSLTNGDKMFNYCYELSYFISDSSGSPVNLSSLTDGNYMFYNCTALTTFTSDLSSLTDGDGMFYCCSALTAFTSDLSSLTDGDGMFNYCTKLRTFTSDLSSLTSAKNMFYNCTALTTFTSDLGSLTNGYEMFFYCTKLANFTGDSSGSPANLSSITNGASMFYCCSALTAFTSDLSSLSDGHWMFYYCSALTAFTSDLSSLTNGDKMFNYCTKLTTFTSDSSGSPANLSSLTHGASMFANCSNLTIFTSDLSSLTSGQSMFYNCTKLTTFTSNLNSLINGYMMFYKTKLTPQSVMYIVDSIKDIVAEKKLYQDGVIPYVTLADGGYSPTKGFMATGSYVYTYNKPQLYFQQNPASNIGNLHIGINVTNNANTILDQLQAFAEEATFDSWDELKQAFVDKGWNVIWQYGGTTTSITYDLRGDRAIPCPIYAQLEEVEDKERAEYSNEEGTKFYNISWGHDVTNYDDFQQFDSLEDAMVAYGVIIKQEEEEQD